MNEHETVIGKRIPKIDSVYLATGEAKFLDDVQIPEMLYGKVLRSPHPHARILHIDAGRAVRLPGVKAVITAEDTTKIKFCHLPITPNKKVLEDETGYGLWAKRLRRLPHWMKKSPGRRWN